MSKAKKKINNWCSKEQYQHVMNSYKSINQELQLYALRSDVKFYNSIKADKLHFNNTVKLFNSYAKENDFEFTFVNKVKNSLHSITNYDKVFRLDGEYYLFHTYRILGFIRETVSAYLLSKDKQFIKGTIAEYKDREKDYYLSEYLDNREQLCKSNNQYKGINLLNSILYRSLYLHKAFTKYYLSYFAIFGVYNIKLIDNDKLESKIIKNTFEVFQSGQVNKKDCAKSLLSVLYYYLVHKMRINKNHALYVVKDLVNNIFGIYSEYRGSELLKNVYVKEVIGSHVIYSFDTKKEHITENKKNYLKDIFMTNPIINHKRFPTQSIKQTLDNPLRLYSLVTPSELLQKI